MNCDNYTALQPTDQAIFIGRLVHAVQNNNSLFEYGKTLIETAEKIGLYENVKIGHEQVFQDPPSVEHFQLF